MVKRWGYPVFGPRRPPLPTWTELLRQELEPAEPPRPCWLSHQAVTDEQTHVLLDCQEGRRLRVRELLRTISRATSAAATGVAA